ncbi:MAG TPA: bifunctional demethylmenaquinone methyltransferase/2-methoxy-6-polyprenyl-1,4-benzoquinol methylase UbiE [Fimbriimonadaceae bacterium]|nr:bifunctional demethylmenaquinone methyltransferase/2-methoxy-6-polyprenyl-1,4-benzoquinol methylase UbiE [Fimbriimonadaceae bacterium]
MEQTVQPWNKEGQEKRQAVQSMFAQIAGKYDRLNAVMSLSLHHKWRQRAVELLQLQPGQKALDVCCGTGDFLPPLNDKVGPSGLVTGIDFCLPMLSQAKDKFGTRRLSLGDACALPVQSEKFDAVTAGWGIRNVPDIDTAHREIFRVLNHGGRFASIDMSKPRNPILRVVSNFVTRRLLPLLGSVFGQKSAYTYLPESTQKFKSRLELVDSMERAGFVDVKYHDLFFGQICIHFGRKP